MATRSIRLKKRNHNHLNGTRVLASPQARRSPFESIRLMIIRHFEREPLGLDRRDVERLAKSMVEIALTNRDRANNIDLP